jgi:hypothetical protein
VLCEILQSLLEFLGNHLLGNNLRHSRLSLCLAFPPSSQTVNLCTPDPPRSGVLW